MERMYASNKRSTERWSGRLGTGLAFFPVLLAPGLLICVLATFEGLDVCGGARCEFLASLAFSAGGAARGV